MVGSRSEANTDLLKLIGFYPNIWGFPIFSSVIDSNGCGTPRWILVYISAAIVGMSPLRTYLALTIFWLMSLRVFQ